MIGKLRISSLPYLLLAFLMVFFLYTHSANIEYDSPSYIQFSPTRPLLYPSFVWLFHWAGSYQFTLIIWTHGILLFSALAYAGIWLKKNLRISDFSIFIIFLFVMFTIAFHYQLWYIQSEGVTFPLFIYTFFYLIDTFQDFSLYKLIYVSIMIGILVLTRLQFYYMYAVLGILIILNYYQGMTVKKFIGSISILALSFLITISVDHGYHYVKHGKTSETSYSAVMILVQALFLADNNAPSYFINPSQRQYINQLINDRNKLNLTNNANAISSLKPYYLKEAYQSYSRNYIALQDIISSTLRNDHINQKITDSDVNLRAKVIYRVIISHEMRKNLIFLFWKFIECMGGITQFIFFSILLSSIPIMLIKNSMINNNVELIFITVSVIITFMNAAMIAAFNPDLPVYFCYTQFILYCIAAFLINKATHVSD